MGIYVISGIALFIIVLIMVVFCTISAKNKEILQLEKIKNELNSREIEDRKIIDDLYVYLERNVRTSEDIKGTRVLPVNEKYIRENIRFMSSKDKLDKILAKTKEAIESRDKLKVEKNELESNVENKSIELNQLKKYKHNHEVDLKRFLESNLVAFPWMAGVMADYLTYDLEIEARKLEWGSNVQREKKVASIRELRKAAQAQVAQAKMAIYQLEYLKQLYPALEDVLDTDYKELELKKEIPEYDPIRDYISKDEWNSLSDSAKNQLALDRYVESRNKSKWQIGRDYELSVAYEFAKEGWDVDTHGSYAGLEDMGRDLIAKYKNKTIIVQCKYWSHEKVIHEKHIFQLYGTYITYCIENKEDMADVEAYFITNIKLSPKAREMAKFLCIKVMEEHPMVDFPRIKCNIGHDEYGLKTHIYHLPMDDQYDTVKIDSKGEFYAFTVAEAESKGFRRAYKWHGLPQ